MNKARAPIDLNQFQLDFQLQQQPNDTSCGPTCLHAIYHFFQDNIPLDRVVQEIPEMENGGTLARIFH